MRYRFFTRRELDSTSMIQFELNWVLGRATLSVAGSSTGVIVRVLLRISRFFGSSDPSFTGQNSDTVPCLYDFLYRRHSPSQGRWISPDPPGLGARTRR